MTILLAVAALIAALAAAGTIWTVRLIRSGGRSWHPGDPLPHVPATAPLRTWHAGAQAARAPGTVPSAASYYGPSYRSPRRTDAETAPSAR